jgi:hypothetical protein
VLQKTKAGYTFCQLILCPQIVNIIPRDEIATRSIECKITGSASPAILRKRDVCQRYPLPLASRAKISKQVSKSISRSVIGQNDFPGQQALAKDVTDRLVNNLGAIENRNKYADPVHRARNPNLPWMRAAKRKSSRVMMCSQALLLLEVELTSSITTTP